MHVLNSYVYDKKVRVQSARAATPQKNLAVTDKWTNRSMFAESADHGWPCKGGHKLACNHSNANISCSEESNVELWSSRLISCNLLMYTLVYRLCMFTVYANIVYVFAFMPLPSPSYYYKVPWVLRLFIFTYCIIGSLFLWLVLYFCFTSMMLVTPPQDESPFLAGEFDVLCKGPWIDRNHSSWD